MTNLEKQLMPTERTAAANCTYKKLAVQCSAEIPIAIETPPSPTAKYYSHW